MRTIWKTRFGMIGFALLLGCMAISEAKQDGSNHAFFYGAIVATDAQAKTITVKDDSGATRAFSIGPETTIEKDTARLGIEVHSILRGTFDDLSIGKRVKILPLAGSGAVLRAKTVVVLVGP